MPQHLTLLDFGLLPTSAKMVRVGEVYGKLTVIMVGQRPLAYRYMAVCICSCSRKIVRVRFESLKAGITVSCGCFHREVMLKHGMSKSLHYGRWQHMMRRCNDSSHPKYKDYGGRGIKVCPEWHDIRVYCEQLPEGYREGMELDRIDNDGDYHPSNVRWATKSVNCDNRRTGHKVTYLGETKSLTEWSKVYGISVATLWERLVVWKWDEEKALTTPTLDAKERMAIARKARWEGHVKASKPKPRVIRTFEFEGRERTVAEISEITGIATKLLRKRLCERAWSVDKAVSDRVK